MPDAVVVGAGPNGLAAAITLAAAGVDVTVLEATDAIGGGVRSSEKILPGLTFDECSAIHVMPAGSRFIREQGLDRHGLQWRWTEVDCAHPLDDGSAGTLHRSVQATAAGLGRDGARWVGKPEADWLPEMRSASRSWFTCSLTPAVGVVPIPMVPGTCIPPDPLITIDSKPVEILYILNLSFVIEPPPAFPAIPQYLLVPPLVNSKRE